MNTARVVCRGAGAAKVAVYIRRGAWVGVVLAVLAACATEPQAPQTSSQAEQTSQQAPQTSQQAEQTPPQAQQASPQAQQTRQQGQQSGAPAGASASGARAAGTADDGTEEVIVTGNRIRRDDFSSPNATAVVTAEDMQAQGVTSVAEMVSRVPDNDAAPSESANSSFSAGAAIANLRSLNTVDGTRTLTLVDGRRFVGDRPLSRVQPGEELWIISRPRMQEAANAGDDQSPGSGALVANVPTDDDATVLEPETVPLPLEHTNVHAVVKGYVGTVDVTQQFTNPFDEKIEAVYLFPLPEKAAVSEFVMTIGERQIRGILREKEEAEQIYSEARAQGYQASLLTQHRPNVFEQKVANIEPGKRIDVNIRYFHTLAYRDGWYSFVFPTVVGPRYNPPGSTDPVLALPRAEFQPTSTAAVRYLKPSERSAHDLSITVKLDAGVAIEEIAASLPVRETPLGGHALQVELADVSMLPNEDFVLDFRVAGETIKSNLLTYEHPESGEGYFTLMLYPPSGLETLARQPLELVFVIDASGSMNGRPIEQAKAAVRAALDRLEPDDTFQIIRFSTNASSFGPDPVPATRDNVRRAKRYVEELAGGGGTQMIEGVKAALDFPHDPRRLRFVTFLTDGYIGNEADILREINARLGASRIFSFGVGSSVNRYLIERMASVGRGAVAYLGLEDSGSEVMEYFFDRISHPALIDVDIDWGRMRVSDVYPSRLPDLFVGRPVVVTGKYAGEPSAPLVRGRASGEPLDFRLAYEPEAAGPEYLPKLWARLRIADLVDRSAHDFEFANELALEIRQTALDYELMSDYTAFIAVDASGITEGEHGTTVYQAVPVPRGVRYDTTVTP